LPKADVVFVAAGARARAGCDVCPNAGTELDVVDSLGLLKGLFDAVLYAPKPVAGLRTLLPPVVEVAPEGGLLAGGTPNDPKILLDGLD
jgi:hypothetical protein